MERVNLLSTDQSSSEVRMTATGQNHTGTRTRAAKGLFSHFMLLAGVILIALLTSGKAYANDFTHTITLDGGVTHISISQTDEKVATLTADAGYTLPTTLTVKMGSSATLTVDVDYTYVSSTGEITIGEEYTVSDNIVITATAIADASLTSLTYTLGEGSPASVTGFAATTTTYDLTVDYTAETSVTLNGEAADGSTIGTPVAANIVKQEDGTQKATATIEVTSNNGGQSTTYTVNFTFNKAKITAVTAPSDMTLTGRVSSENDVIAQLPKTVTVTTDDPTVTSLDITWECKGDNFSAAAAAQNTFTWTATVPETLDVNGQTVTNDITVTNVAASTDTKLAKLIYTIGDDETESVIFDEVELDATAQKYDVPLLATVAKDATIKVTATPNDQVTSVTYDHQSIALSDNKATINLTITPESGTPRSVAVNFTRAKSTVATLASLKYQIGTATAIGMPEFAPDGTSYEVALPYTTADGTVITLLAVATDAANATITGETTVTLSKGTGSTTLTVTPEEGTAQTVTITFNVSKEKILSITAPTAPVLEKAMTAEEVLAKVNAIEKVAITTESGAPTELPISWALKAETVFKTQHGAKNEYTWTIAPEKYANYDLAKEVKTSGDITVVNFIDAIKEDMPDGVTIDENNPYTQIGEEDAKETITVKEVIVSTPLDNLSFNNVKVAEKLSLNKKVTQILLNKASVGEVTLDANGATTLVLKPGSTIGKIANEGTLTLTNSEILLASVSPRSMLMDTRAAVATEVVNNGTFTDETATIFTVTGAANVAITQLPQSQTTTGKNAELSVTATAVDDATISYQWQMQKGSSWSPVSGATTNKLAIVKESNGTTSYRCEVRSAKGSAQTILYTPAVSVTFKTASDPSTPSDPTPSTKTYTVTLKKVTGATFSKGETTEVEEGDSFSFSIKLDKDYDQSKPVVKVGTTTYEPDAKGVYTIKNISKDITIEVSGIVKNAATGVEETAQDAVRVWGEGSTLYIHTPEAAEVYVISGAGALLRELKAVPGDQNLQLPAGFYIVRVGTYTAKVIIR